MDHVDLYQIHRWDSETPIEETMEALHDVVRAGKARYIGASSMYAWQFARAQHVAETHGWTQFVSMQNHLNLVYREEEREMLPLCSDDGIGVIPWSPLARGLLAGNRGRGGDKRTTRAQTDAFNESCTTHRRRLRVVDRVAEVAGERGVPPAQVALAWLLHKPGVTAPIVGATKPGHLEDALAATDVVLSRRGDRAPGGALRAACGVGDLLSAPGYTVRRSDRARRIPRERRPRPRGRGHAAAPGAPARRRSGRGRAAAVDRPPGGGGRRRPGRGREPRRRDPLPRRDAAARAGAGRAARAPHAATRCGCRRTTRLRSSAGCAAPRATRSRPAPTAPRRPSASRSRACTIRDPRTRWGSCSSSGSLSFSWRLVLAPEDVLDYVVWHEVCHLREMNHSPRYWALVARHCPGYEEPRRWLRRNATALRVALTG